MSCFTCFGRISVKSFLYLSTSVPLFLSPRTFFLSLFIPHLYACKQDFRNCAYTSPTNYYHHWVGSMQRYKLNWFTSHNGAMESASQTITIIIINFVVEFMLGSTTEDWSTPFWMNFDYMLPNVANKYHVNDVTCHFPITITLDVQASNFKFHVPPIISIRMQSMQSIPF